MATILLPHPPSSLPPFLSPCPSSFHSLKTDSSQKIFVSCSSSSLRDLVPAIAQGSSPSSDNTAVPEPDTADGIEENSSFRGCKTCGRGEIEKGCNGEGRIQGGIATVRGFSWWPIKAFRPCPGFVASGGRYKRHGQSMDEVAFGKTESDISVNLKAKSTRICFRRRPPLHLACPLVTMELQERRMKVHEG